MSVTRRIILDTDPGQDDALALYLALASPEVDLAAVVTVAGNVGQPLVTDNALALLELADRSDVPVYRGADFPLVRDQYTAEYVHGDTGIDGADIPKAVGSPEPQHGVDFIIETCLASEDASVTLCPIGPLTNIATAIQTEPRIVPKIRDILWMGGAIDEPPNTMDVAEFNAYVDPHAADIVLTSGAPVTMFPLDVTHKAILDAASIDRLARAGTAVTTACAGMSTFYAQHDAEKYGFEGAVMHDPCVIAYLIAPSLFESQTLPISVETIDEATQGTTRVAASGSPTTVVMDVDSDKLIDLCVSRWEKL